MRIIYCIRHAKSSWGDFSLPDIDRPLNKRGQRDGPIMASHLAKECVNVDLLLLSPSQRTKETAEFFQSALNIDNTIVKDDIYHASTDTLLDQILSLDPEIKVACMIGHNPGMTDLYNHFSSTLLDNLPTCGIFRLKINAPDWSDMDTSNTEVDYLIYPKMLH